MKCTESNDCHALAYCDDVTKYCELCSTICLPSRGLQNDCDKACPGFDYDEYLADIKKLPEPKLASTVLPNATSPASAPLFPDTPGNQAIEVTSDADTVLITVVIAVIVVVVIIVALIVFICVKCEDDGSFMARFVKGAKHFFMWLCCRKHHVQQEMDKANANVDIVHSIVNSQQIPHQSEYTSHDTHPPEDPQAVIVESSLINYEWVSMSNVIVGTENTPSLINSCLSMSNETSYSHKKTSKFKRFFRSLSCISRPSAENGEVPVVGNSNTANAPLLTGSVRYQSGCPCHSVETDGGPINEPSREPLLQHQSTDYGSKQSLNLHPSKPLSLTDPSVSGRVRCKSESAGAGIITTMDMACRSDPDITASNGKNDNNVSDIAHNSEQNRSNIVPEQDFNPNSQELNSTQNIIDNINQQNRSSFVQYPEQGSNLNLQDSNSNRSPAVLSVSNNRLMSDGVGSGYTGGRAPVRVGSPTSDRPPLNNNTDFSHSSLNRNNSYPNSAIELFELDCYSSTQHSKPGLLPGTAIDLTGPESIAMAAWDGAVGGFEMRLPETAEDDDSSSIFSEDRPQQLQQIAAVQCSESALDLRVDDVRGSRHSSVSSSMEGAVGGALPIPVHNNPVPYQGLIIVANPGANNKSGFESTPSDGAPFGGGVHGEGQALQEFNDLNDQFMQQVARNGYQGQAPQNAHQPIGVPIENVFPVARRKPTTNKDLYDKLKKIDWVMGYYSQGRSIDVLVNLGSLNPRDIEQQLSERTGAPATKFHVKRNEDQDSFNLYRTNTGRVRRVSERSDVACQSDLDIITGGGVIRINQNNVSDNTENNKPNKSNIGPEPDFNQNPQELISTQNINDNNQSYSSSLVTDPEQGSNLKDSNSNRSPAVLSVSNNRLMSDGVGSGNTGGQAPVNAGSPQSDKAPVNVDTAIDRFELDCFSSTQHSQPGLLPGTTIDLTGPESIAMAAWDGAVGGFELRLPETAENNDSSGIFSEDRPEQRQQIAAVQCSESALDLRVEDVRRSRHSSVSSSMKGAVGRALPTEDDGSGIFSEDRPQQRQQIADVQCSALDLREDDVRGSRHTSVISSMEGAVGGALPIPVHSNPVPYQGLIIGANPGADQERGFEGIPPFGEAAFRGGTHGEGQALQEFNHLTNQFMQQIARNGPPAVKEKQLSLSSDQHRFSLPWFAASLKSPTPQPLGLPLNATRPSPALDIGSDRPCGLSMSQGDYRLRDRTLSSASSHKDEQAPSSAGNIASMDTHSSSSICGTIYL